MNNTFPAEKKRIDQHQSLFAFMLIFNFVQKWQYIVTITTCTCLTLAWDGCTLKTSQNPLLPTGATALRQSEGVNKALSNQSATGQRGVGIYACALSLRKTSVCWCRSKNFTGNDNLLACSEKKKYKFYLSVSTFLNIVCKRHYAVVVTTYI